MLLLCCRKIFVGGLKGETTESKLLSNTCWQFPIIIINYFLNVLEDLSEHFGQFGEIEYINVKLEAATGRCRGFAFIVYKTMQGMDNVSTPFYSVYSILKF